MYDTKFKRLIRWLSTNLNISINQTKTHCDETTTNEYRFARADVTWIHSIRSKANQSNVIVDIDKN